MAITLVFQKGLSENQGKVAGGNFNKWSDFIINFRVVHSFLSQNNINPRSSLLLFPVVLVLDSTHSSCGRVRNLFYFLYPKNLFLQHQPLSEPEWQRNLNPNSSVKYILRPVETRIFQTHPLLFFQLVETRLWELLLLYV